MRLLFTTIVLLLGTGVAARTPPLANPALLNIGFSCQWDNRCMKRQEKAMTSSLRHVRKLPEAKVRLCSRNASRGQSRIDWIGFNNCVRNKQLEQQPAAAPRRITPPQRRSKPSPRPKPPVRRPYERG